ncbi:MAG: hypothetical protein AAB262_02565, partial [Elusimicrobiota bacterium]
MKTRPSVRASLQGKSSQAIDFLRRHALCLVALQCAVYFFAYDALMPGGMYFSPDGVLYLQVSNIVPPTFALLARALIKIEVGLGSTRIVLLRYVVMAIYCLGGWLIAKALARSGRPLRALLVLPALWSMSSLTQWFNYFLTDGIAAALLIASLGAYANMHVGIQEEEGRPGGRSRYWLLLFVLLGMGSFSMRPACSFIAPAMVVMMLSR